MKLSLGITTRDYSAAGGVTYDTDALAYFTANTAITSAADKNAINTFYLGLKSDGIYTKIKAMYLPIWGSAATSKWNLINPLDTNAAFRLTFTTGWTYASSGITPNGTSAYADTFLTPSTTLSLNNSHLSLYNRTNATSYFNATKIDGTNLTNISMAIIPATTNYGGRFMDDTYSTVSSTNALGFYVGNRTLSTQKKYYKNGALGGTFNVNSIALADNILRIGVIVGNGFTVYSSGQCSFASIGDGLTDTDATNFYNRVNTLMTYFGINV